MLQHEALPFLMRIQSADDVIAAAEDLHQSVDSLTQLAIAYAFAKAGRIPEAAWALQQYALTLNRTVQWQRASAEKAEHLAEVLLSDAAEARRMLRRWENETAQRLNVAAFRTGE
jgi:hypothetical protein